MFQAFACSGRTATTSRKRPADFFSFFAAAS
jgi:hypothetical protein